MIITSFEKTLLLRGEVTAPSKVEHGMYLLEIAGEPIGTFQLREIQLKNEKTMRAIHVDCDLDSWDFDATLTEASRRELPVAIHAQSTDGQAAFEILVEKMSSKILLTGKFSGPRNQGPINCRVTIDNAYVADAEIYEPENTKAERYAYFQSTAECELAIATALNAGKRCELVLEAR